MRDSGGGARVLPRSLLVVIALIGLTALLVGEYLEWKYSEWVDGHQFTTNLLSSIVGFSTVTFVVGIWFAGLNERARRAPYEDRIVKALVEPGMLYGSALPGFTVATLTGSAIREYSRGLDAATNESIPSLRLQCTAAKRVFDDHIKVYAELFLIPSSGRLSIAFFSAMEGALKNADAQFGEASRKLEYSSNRKNSGNKISAAENRQLGVEAMQHFLHSLAHVLEAFKSRR